MLMPMSGVESLERALELGFVMDLGQHIHAPIVGRCFEFAGKPVVDHRHDEQDAIGAPGARFRDLIGIEHEILAQRGKAAHRARGAEIFRRALEGRRIGEDGKAGGAALLIGHGQFAAD